MYTPTYKQKPHKKFVKMMVRILSGFATPSDVKTQYDEFRHTYEDPQSALLAYTVEWSRNNYARECKICRRMAKEGLISGDFYRFSMQSYR